MEEGQTILQWKRYFNVDVGGRTSPDRGDGTEGQQNLNVGRPTGSQIIYVIDRVFPSYTQGNEW